MLLTPAPSATEESQIVNDYATWAASRWVSSHHLGIDADMASKVVMVMGLAGETGEVAEVLEDWLETGIRDDITFSKEVGDAFYYWARIVPTFGFDAGTLFTRAAPPASNCVRQERVVRQVLKLTVAQGVVLEVCKKYIRDFTLHPEKLDDGLYQYALAWRELCQALGYDWKDILTQNRQKIEGRNSRGTMRGSGNDR